MRFQKNSPAIPDELLIARDEGRVVFFCGAGVSRARAGLADFYGLAEGVISILGVPEGSTVCKVLAKAEELSSHSEMIGLISADRIFGLLEKDFDVSDIEASVAEVLRPAEGVDLSAHQVLLDLATTPEGRVQLVTTNFDRLFEKCSDGLEICQPPSLPVLSNERGIDGITYLHGRINDQFDGADGNGLILTSSSFGQAYLADAWATQFVRSIIDRYTVVFVGYAADDPPVHYLLEALNKRFGAFSNVYAFQSGSEYDATAKWEQKGVNAIPYSDEDGHRALWDSLEAWAERARDSDAWYYSIIDRAKNGPEKLQPHERGQVAHVISTVDGARKFSESSDLPPAEWLCVFDPSQRYALPKYVGEYGEEEIFVDPFERYGLDSDIVPSPVKPGDRNAKRDIPSKAWDGFAANRLDRRDNRDGSFAAIRGYGANCVPRLSPRLLQMADWITRISHQSTAVWWASGQSGLHMGMKWGILRHLGRAEGKNIEAMRQAWQYLFDQWEREGHKQHYSRYGISRLFTSVDWNASTIRRYFKTMRPYLKVTRCRGAGHVPPKWTKGFDLDDLLELTVEYPRIDKKVDIPQHFLGHAVHEYRSNLETALRLETEIGGLGLYHIHPISNDQNGSNHGRERGLSGMITSFTEMFLQLVEFDVNAAKQEFRTWSLSDDSIFSRLRIWASGMEAVVPPGEFKRVIMELSDVAFSEEHHDNDLLNVLASRWPKLTKHSRKLIERRLLRGRAKWDRESDEGFKESNSWSILNRLQWLADKGCEFTFDLKTAIAKLRGFSDEWKPEYAASNMQSMKTRCGPVHTETEHSVLLHEPLGNILAKAHELSGRTDDVFVENNPYLGLSDEHPLRAYFALVIVAMNDEYPVWAWRTFLNAKGRKSDPPKLMMLISESISRAPDTALEKLLHPISDWLLRVSPVLMVQYPQSSNGLIDKIVNILGCDPDSGYSAIIRGSREPDWATEAINSPVGKIAQALFNDPTRNDRKAGEGFPEGWLARVERLLSLPDDLRCYALVIFANVLGWFYLIDSVWTEETLVSGLSNGSESERDAIWSGYFWGARLPRPELYVRLKPDLIALSSQDSYSYHKYGETLSSIMLTGWRSTVEGTGERYISNKEMRDVLLNANEDFHSHILWQVENWARDDERNSEWLTMLPDFFDNVWPRQKAIRTPIASAMLCNLLFLNKTFFPDIAKIIIPRLTTASPDRLMLPEPEEDSEIFDLYPKETLAILYAILPENVASWSYGVDDILQRIVQADDKSKFDYRFIELKRRWNSR